MKIKWNNDYSKWIECGADSVAELDELKAQIKAMRDEAHANNNFARRQALNDVLYSMTKPKKMLRAYESGGNVVAEPSEKWTVESLTANVPA